MIRGVWNNFTPSQLGSQSHCMLFVITRLNVRWKCEIFHQSHRHNDKFPLRKFVDRNVKHKLRLGNTHLWGVNRRKRKTKNKNENVKSTKIQVNYSCTQIARLCMYPPLCSCTKIVIRKRRRSKHTQNDTQSHNAVQQRSSSEW